MKVLKKESFPLIVIFILLYFYEISVMLLEDNPPAYYNYVVLLLFTISSIYTIQNNVRIANNYIKVFIIMMSLMYILTISHLASTQFPAQIYFVTLILPVPLIVTTRCLFARNNSEVNLFLTMVLVLCLLIFFFRNFQPSALIDIMDQNASSYILLYFMPFILCVNKNWIKIIGIVLVFLSLIVTLKRGGTIAFVAGIIIYFIFEMIRNKKSSRSICFFLAISSLILFALFYALNYVENISSNAFSDRINNIATDEGSGRTETWDWIYNRLLSSNIFELFFGHGWNSVYFQSGIRSAHNDFLELLYDYGIIVFLLYLYLYKSLFVYSYKLLKEKSKFAAPLICSTVILLVNSCVSHIVFYPQCVVVYCLFWAYIEQQTSSNIRYKKLFITA